MPWTHLPRRWNRPVPGLQRTWLLPQSTSLWVLLLLSWLLAWWLLPFSAVRYL